MFVDVMGKVQNWVSLAQLRIDAARNDLKNLKKELIARSKELAAKNQEIAVAKQILMESGFPAASLDKIMAERSQKMVGPLQSPSAMSFKPMRQAMPIGILSASSGQVGGDSGNITNELSAVQYQQHFGAGGQPEFGPGSQPLISPGGQPLLSPGGQPLLSPEGQPLFAPGNQSQFGSEIQGQVALGTQTARDEITADVAVQSGKGKEKTRESELEAELARLRKENETIMKERADYENAIQRALLRGVSSLNAETLKVLRCPPPVSCYAPCGPPPENAGENITVCGSSRTKEERGTTGCRIPTGVSPRRGASKICVNEEYSQNRGCCSARKPTTSAYGTSSRNRKNSAQENHGLTFILQQPTSPPACTAPCNNNSHSRSWSRGKSKKLDVSICTKNLE